MQLPWSRHSLNCCIKAADDLCGTDTTLTSGLVGRSRPFATRASISILKTSGSTSHPHIAFVYLVSVSEVCDYSAALNVSLIYTARKSAQLHRKQFHLSWANPILFNFFGGGWGGGAPCYNDTKLTRQI